MHVDAVCYSVTWCNIDLKVCFNECKMIFFIFDNL